MNTNIKHDWPKDQNEFRRWRINPNFAPSNAKRQAADFARWVAGELKGLYPSVKASELIETHVPTYMRVQYKMAATVPRWYVCIELDEFSMPPKLEETGFALFLKLFRLRKAGKPVEPKRVLRYYSMSPRQYETFKELMEVKA